MKPKIIFFCRDYQAQLFPKLQSEDYQSIYIAYNIKEKNVLISNGYECTACFEEDYNSLGVTSFNESYLETSFTSDRYFGKLSLNKRRLYLSKSIAFWQKVFDQIKPNFILNEVIAIEFSEIMYIEAKRRGIKYLAWMISPFQVKQFYWLSSPFHASIDQKELDLPVSSEAVVLANKLLQNPIDKPYYVTGLSNRHSVKIFIKSFGKYLYNKLHYFILLRRDRELFYFNHSKYYKQEIFNYINSFLYGYANIEDYIKFEKVFYPLHYEPEASLTYFSEFFDDQFNTIFNVSKCLKHDQILIVKEHPQQPGILLSNKFRELKKRLSNVIFLPSEVSASNIIMQCEYVVTISSTAGWEALLNQKPVFLLGKVFYDKHEDVNVIKSFSQLKKSIRSGNYKRPQIEHTKNFIARFYEYCSQGNPYPNVNIYSEQKHHLH